MLFVSMVPEAPPIDWEILKGTPLDNRDKAVVQLSARQPLAYLLRGFLNSSEVLQLVQTAQQQYGAGGFIWKAAHCRALDPSDSLDAHPLNRLKAASTSTTCAKPSLILYMGVRESRLS
jgi:hypothetical protein